MGEKVEVSIDSEGQVLKCAKGLSGDDCGFTPGAKVCGKCGAMPVEMKMVRADLLEKVLPMMDDEEEEDMPMAKKKSKAPVITLGTDEQEEDTPDDEAAEASKKSARSAGMRSIDMDVPEGEDEEVDALNAEDMGEEESMKGYGVDLEGARKKRLASMGAKSAELGRNAYLCGIERKVYPGGVSVCDDCPGGCVSEKGMPGLLSVEGIAEDMFQGKVLDSGYSSDADMFVVDVQAKDGRAVEVFVDGTTAEVLGWHKLDDNAFEQKSALDAVMVIDFTEAADIAVKSIQGSVMAVEPDIFEGFDAYAVEIEGIDGKSYDVFVSLDGEVLGYDKYEPEEAQDIEAEAAEIALKRAFSEDERTKLADEGMALPDGSFPIKSTDDLKNAISAFGRAKDKEAAKRHIMKRAKALGAEKMIPAAWLTGGAKVIEEKSGEVDAELMSSLLEFELLNAEVNEQDSSN